MMDWTTASRGIVHHVLDTMMGVYIHCMTSEYPDRQQTKQLRLCQLESERNQQKGERGREEGVMKGDKGRANLIQIFNCEENLLR
jgi:hypothetical protein